MATRGWAAPAFAAVGLVLVGVALIGPVVAALFDVARDPVLAFTAATDGLLVERLVRTLGLALTSLGIATVVGIALAWCFVRTDLPGRRLLLVLAPFPLFLPPLVHVLSWFSAVGLQGRAAVVTVYAVSFTPLVTLLSARALDGVTRGQAEQWRLVGGRRAVVLDDLRQALPAGLVGAALGLVMILNDFAVADFLSSVGEKVTVYGESLYRYHMASPPAAAAGAALPGLLVSLLALLFVLRARRRLGTSVDAQFERAPPVALGRMRWPVALLCTAVIAAGTAFPIGVLLSRAGSLDAVVTQATQAGDRVVFSVTTGAIAAFVVVGVAVALAVGARGRRRPLLFDFGVFLPIALPAVLYGIGLIRVWNRPGLDAIYLGPTIVVLALAARHLAFAFLPVAGALERVSDGLLEAARTTGAGPVRRFVRIVLPLVAPTLLASFCTVFCLAWRELDTLVMLRAGQQSLTWKLYADVTFSSPEDVAALTLVLVVLAWTPMALLSIVSRERPRLL